MNLQDRIKIAEQNLAAVRAHEKGLPVEVAFWKEEGWRVSSRPEWEFQYHNYRPAPITFPAPPEGQEWHNPHGLSAEQVGVHDGWRLLLNDERVPNDAEYYSRVMTCGTHWNVSAQRGLTRSTNDTLRTKFPLPQPKKRVPLEAKDVPPGSVLRRPARSVPDAWMAVTSVGLDGLNVWCFAGNDGKLEGFCWGALSTNGYEILRPGGTWEPCWKEE